MAGIGGAREQHARSLSPDVALNHDPAALKSLSAGGLIEEGEDAGEGAPDREDCRSKLAGRIGPEAHQEPRERSALGVLSEGRAADDPGPGPQLTERLLERWREPWSSQRAGELR